MTPIFPLEPFLLPLAQNPWTYLVFGLIGFAFGYVLEISGFGNSNKLAAQFYFKDLTVLKVMFTAIVTAMVLLYLSAAIGILDINLVYINETYLWPGIVGGVIMGFGFIIGGFCPGTSVVSASTLKLDGVAFLLGAFFGVFAFGEVVQYFWEWWNTSGYYGRLTLMDAFGLPTGVVVVAVVLMALFMFWGGEHLERIFGKRDLKKEPKLRVAGAAVLLGLAVVTLLIGQPTNAEKYQAIAAEKETVLAERSVQIHPAELLDSLYNQRLEILMVDVRPESDYNLFHIRGAQRVDLAGLPALSADLLASTTANRVVVLMSNDETAATAAWKYLVAESVPNVYILEGGVNNWIAVFGGGETDIRPLAGAGDDQLSYAFPAALGDRFACAAPSAHDWQIEYLPKIKLELRRSPSGGGCG